MHTPPPHPAPRPTPRRSGVPAFAVILIAIGCLLAGCFGGAVIMSMPAATDPAAAASASPSGRDEATVSACRAADRATSEEDRQAENQALAAAAASSEPELQAIAKEFATREHLTEPIKDAHRLAAVYQVSTWCLNNDVTN